MFEPKFTITPKINKTLVEVEIERVRGFLDAVKLKDDWISDMQERALILESHHSTHIEGTALNLEQAKNIFEGKKIKGINKDDEKELLNYKKTMDFISKYLGKADPVTEGFIRELHKILVKGVRGKQIIRQDVTLQKIKKIGLNLRQEKVIKYIIKNSKITVNEYQSVASCIRRTAQRDLEELIVKGIIKAVAKSATDPTKHYVLL